MLTVLTLDHATDSAAQDTIMTRVFEDEDAGRQAGTVGS